MKVVTKLMQLSTELRRQLRKAGCEKPGTRAELSALESLLPEGARVEPKMSYSEECRDERLCLSLPGGVDGLEIGLTVFPFLSADRGFKVRASSSAGERGEELERLFEEALAAELP